MTAGGADPCELATRLPQVLSRWLPGISITDNDPDLLLEVIGEDKELQVVLQNKNGEVVLRRDVPRAENACPAEADGVALIVDRYLRDLGWEPPAAALPSKTPVETATPAATATIAEAPIAPDEPLELAFFSAVFAGGEVNDRGPRFTLAPGLALRFAIGEHFEIVGEGSIGLPRSEAVIANGTIETWHLRFLLGAGWCTAVGAGKICGGARGGIDRVQAAVAGDALFQSNVQWKASGVVALSLRWDFAGLDPFLFSAEALLVGRAPPLSFFVEVAEGTRDYTTPQISGAFRLAGWVRFF